MKLVVGLGNIGEQFKNTRHNVGFIAIDYILKLLNLSNENKHEKFNGEIVLTKINNESFIFVKPQTYMNLSGNCVGPLMQYYHLSPEDLIVIQDDLDQPLGNFKIKTIGSDGGHNGIKDIITKLNINNFIRFKIGVGRPTSNSHINVVSHLTEIKFKNEELKNLNLVLKKVYDFINLLSQYPTTIALSKLNER